MRRFNEEALGTQSIVSTSPNHQYGLVLTSQGVLESNQIKSTLWLIDYRKLRIEFRNAAIASTSRPTPLATVAVIPRLDARNTGAYGSVVFDVRWSVDSRDVYFLGENSKGNRQLYNVSVASRVVKALTPANQDVESFDVVRNTILYRASENNDNSEIDIPGEVISSNVSVVTGLPIADILANRGPHKLSSYDLWCIRSGRRGLILRVPPHVQASSFLLARPLSLSPNAQFAIMLSPAKTIPESWERFETPVAFTTLRLNRHDLRPISPYNSGSPLREYLLVDLQRHTARALGAVDAGYFNFAGSVSVHWSGDSNSVLITRAFLSPRETDTTWTNIIPPCEAAVFEIKGHTARCLVSGGSASAKPPGVFLQSAWFGSDGNEVALRYGLYGQEASDTAIYRCFNHEWTSSKAPSVEFDSLEKRQEPSIMLTVKEDLNERPTLCAKDLATGKEMKVWDPNPDFEQLELAQASVYHWTDRHGRSWTGGLFKPLGFATRHRYPLVIQTHGFTPNKFVLDGAYPTTNAARALASSGVIVLQVGRGGDPAHNGSVEEANDNVEAYETAIDSLDTTGIIDKNKVGIVGFSRTCWYVENALIKAPQRYAAAIIADGVNYSYMQYHFFGPGNAFVQRDDEQVIGSVPIGKGLQKWLELAPDFRSDQIAAPLRIEAIQPISVLEEWELYSTLAMQGKPVDLIYYPDGQHVLQKPLERLASEQGEVDWFRFWLLGYEDTVREKSSQYHRWRQMKESLKTGDPD